MSEAVVRRVVDALPAAAWDVSVWRADLEHTYVNGRIDRADQYRIVGLLIAELFGPRPERACSSCGAAVLVAVHDSGNPLPVELGPDPSGWLEVWHDGRWWRVSGADLGTHPGATRHQPHTCQHESTPAG